jgi:hypothetical protein
MGEIKTGLKFLSKLRNHYSRINQNCKTEIGIELNYPTGGMMVPLMMK